MALNANKVKYEGTGSKVEPLEAGNYPARIVQIVDLGMQEQRPFQGQEKPPAYMLRVVYEMTTEFMDGDDGNPDTDRPRWLAEEFPLFSLQSERAKSTVRYLALDPECEYEGDWTQLLGKECTVTVVQNANKKTGKVYANVGSVTPAMKGMVIDELKNDPVIFDMDEPDLDVYETFPDWLKEKITSGVHFETTKLAVALGTGGTTPPPAGTQVDEALPV